LPKIQNSSATPNFWQRKFGTAGCAIIPILESYGMVERERAQECDETALAGAVITERWIAQ